MTIEEAIADRGIKEVLHFTTSSGLVGILDSHTVKPRARLANDQRLEFILRLNAEVRRDLNWLDYVNLSVSQINRQYFGASGWWHRSHDLWWCILSFRPEILGHKGVVFTTTNNIYTGVVRGKGLAGLEMMFAEVAIRWSGNTVKRSPATPRYITTCEQAEVLYPGELSTEFLQRIYVARDDHQDEAHGQLLALNHPGVDILVDPTKF